MEAPVRNTASSLKDALFLYPYEFEFCQALKILEVLHPECLSLGQFSSPSQEVVSLKSRVAYAYPPSDLYQLHRLQQNTPYTLEVNFLGIGGPHGPLPMPYSDMLIERTHQKDLGFQEFLNIFNHRILSLLYRIRKKYWVHLETKTPENTGLASVLLSYLGLGMPSYRHRMDIPDRSLLSYAGLIWRTTKSEGGYTALISDYFGVTCRIQTFEGEWLSLEKDQLTYLTAGNPWRRLGRGASLGQKAWTITRTCRVSLGPLSLAQFKKFLPGQQGYQHFKSLSHFYMGLDHHVRINLILKKEDIPPLCLNKKIHLGWDSWLSTHSPLQDDHQVILN